MAYPNPGGRPKEKPFRDALRLEIAAAGENHKALRRVAKALLDKASDGDVAAINTLADRLDGKVPQAVVGDAEHDPVQMIVTGVLRAGEQDQLVAPEKPKDDPSS